MSNSLTPLLQATTSFEVNVSADGALFLRLESARSILAAVSEPAAAKYGQRRRYDFARAALLLALSFARLLLLCWLLLPDESEKKSHPQA